MKKLLYFLLPFLMLGNLMGADNKFPDNVYIKNITGERIYYYIDVVGVDKHNKLENGETRAQTSEKVYSVAINTVEMKNRNDTSYINAPIKESPSATRNADITARFGKQAYFVISKVGDRLVSSGPVSKETYDAALPPTGTLEDKGENTFPDKVYIKNMTGGTIWYYLDVEGVDKHNKLENGETRAQTSEKVYSVAINTVEMKNRNDTSYINAPIRIGPSTELNYKITNLYGKDARFLIWKKLDETLASSLVSEADFDAGKIPEEEEEKEISSLTPDTLIAIKTSTGKYLSTNATDRLLKATGTSKTQPECQFKVLRKDNLFGLQSAVAGNNNLQSNPAGTQIKFDNQNFSDWEYWTLIGTLEKAKFLNGFSKKYLLVSGDNVLSDATGSEFTIEIISEEEKKEISSLTPDTLIAIKTSTGKYLSTNATDRLLKATGTSKTQPECQFKVLRKDNLFGLQSAVAGNNNLQSNPAGTQIKFNNQNFSDGEYWTLSGTLEKTKFLSKASNKYLLVSAVSGDNVAADLTGSEFTIEIIQVQIWCLNANGQVYYRTGIDTNNPFGTGWSQPTTGLLRHISVGPNGQIWGINKEAQACYRTGIDANNPWGTDWTLATPDTAKYTQISVGPSGQIWCLNANGQVYYRTGINANNPFGTGWQGVPGSLKQISVGPQGQIWGVNSNDQIYYRSGINANNPFGTGWTQAIPDNGRLKQISVGPRGQIWGVNSNDVIFYRTGIDANNPFGTGWTQAIPDNGRLKQISVGPQGQIWGVTASDVIFYRTGIDANNPFGTGWTPALPDTARYTQISVATVAGTAIEEETTVAGTEDTLPQTTPATDLAADTLIAIKTSTGKYLSTNATDRLLKATGTSKTQPECQFKVLRKDNLFGLQSAVAGNNNLQSNPAGTQIKFDNQNFSDGEYWTLSGTLEKTKFLSKAANKYLLVSGDNVLSDATGSEFTIEIISLLSSDFPDTYTCITSSAALDEITMGCKDGKLEIWGIDADNKVYRFNELSGAPYTMPTAIVDPWEAQDLKDQAGVALPGLSGICATCDGKLFGIKADDKTAVKYDWAKKQWTKMNITNAAQIKLEEITGVKDSEIYASSEDDKIYQLKNNTWVQISSGSSVAAGIGTDSKSIVIGISTAGVPYKFENGKWTALGKDIQLNKVAIGNQKYIVGINTKNQLVQWDGKKKIWDLVPGKKEKSIESVDDIAAIASKTTVALDKFGNTWHKGTDSVKITAGKVQIIKSTTTTVTTAVAKKKVSAAPKKKTVKKVSKKKAKKTKTPVKRVKVKRVKKTK
jgi:hypothetical protein